MNKKLYINYSAYCDNGGVGLDEDHNSESISIDVHSLAVNPDHAFDPSLKVDAETFQLDEAYLLVVRYYNAETNGCRSGQYEFVAIFPNEKDANIVKNDILKHAYEQDKQGVEYNSYASISIPNPAYPKGKIDASSWIGYCDGIEHIDILKLQIKKA